MCYNHIAETIEFELPSAITEFGQAAFKCCRHCRKVTIPASVEIIHAKCFKHCTSLQLVEFEKGGKLNDIADMAFSGCGALTTITIPSSVRTIGVWCFSENLCQIEFEEPSQLREIGSLGDYSLDRIDIPDLVREIDALPSPGKSHSCVVMFGRESQLAVIPVCEIEEPVRRRAFARYSEGTLRRLRDFATISADP
jgi:hypothetical protein